MSMDSLQELLGKHARPEPPEIAAIKKYVYERYQTDVKVSIQDQSVTILAPGAALAGTLRMNIYDLQQACGITKRIIIRIR